MRRREFITLLGGVASSFAAPGQEPGRIYRLGAMIPVGQQTPAIIAFFDEMRLFGFIEGQNLMVLPNGFGVRNDELVERAEALVKAAPDVIITGPDNYTRVLQQRTLTIPLVAMTEDMLRAGLVTSLARPGGNITGNQPALARTRRQAAGNFDRGGAWRAQDGCARGLNHHSAAAPGGVAGCRAPAWR